MLRVIDVYVVPVESVSKMCRVCVCVSVCMDVCDTALYLVCRALLCMMANTGVVSLPQGVPVSTATVSLSSPTRSGAT